MGEPLSATWIINCPITVERGNESNTFVLELVKWDFMFYFVVKWYFVLMHNALPLFYILIHLMIALPKVSSIGTSVQVTPSLRSAVFWQHWKQKLPMTGFKRLMSKMTAHCATVILSTIKLEELKSLYDLGTSNHHRDLVSSNLVTFSFCFVLKWLHSFQI